GVVLRAPGVAPAAGSNTLRTKAGVRSATPDSGFTFAGMRARNNSLSIDGLDNRDETTGASRVAVGQEAVAEFRVSASSVAPEFGGAAAGTLNVVTLSGSNRYHRSEEHTSELQSLTNLACRLLLAKKNQPTTT